MGRGGILDLGVQVGVGRGGILVQCMYKWKWGGMAIGQLLLAYTDLMRFVGDGSGSCTAMCSEISDERIFHICFV